MKLQYLKYFKKWLVHYNNKAIAVGNTPTQAIEEAFTYLKVVKGLRHN